MSNARPTPRYPLPSPMHMAPCTRAACTCSLRTRSCTYTYVQASTDASLAPSPPSSPPDQGELAVSAPAPSASTSTSDISLGAIPPEASAKVPSFTLTEKDFLEELSIDADSKSWGSKTAKSEMGADNLSGKAPLGVGAPTILAAAASDLSNADEPPWGFNLGAQSNSRRLVTQKSNWFHEPEELDELEEVSIFEVR